MPAHLYTRHYPDPDLLIRTSGELRLSNFLLWQLSYTEIYVTQKLWPDFGKETCAKPFADFNKRRAPLRRPLIIVLMEKPQTILIVDPETDFLEWAQHQLRTPTTRVITATTSDEGFKLFCRERPDLLIVETHLAPFSGMELLVKVRQRDPNAIVVLTSAFGTTQLGHRVDEARRIRLHPQRDAPFQSQGRRGCGAEGAGGDEARRPRFKPQLTVEEHQDSIVGKSPAMQQVFKMVGRVSHSDAPVMITGESGTGKELVARAMHHYSASASTKSFVAINCAAIPEQLLESELFGHEKGSFTGATGTARRALRADATAARSSSMRSATCRCSLQSKILRVLQDGEFSRVGGNAT